MASGKIKQIAVYNDNEWKIFDLDPGSSAGLISVEGIAGVTSTGTGLTTVQNALEYISNNRVPLVGNSTVTATDFIIQSTVTDRATLKLQQNYINTEIGKDIPTDSFKVLNGIQMGGSGTLMEGSDGWGYGFVSECVKNTSDRLYQNFIVQRYNGTTRLRNALYLGINANGTPHVSVSGSGGIITTESVKAAWRNALGVPSTEQVPPISHASEGTEYGIGTTKNYGHTKVINNLTTSTSAHGQALNAYQGYLLSTKVTKNTNNISTLTTNVSKLNHIHLTVNINDFSLATTSDKSVGNKVFSAGSYLIIGKASFSSNATGRRSIGLNTTKDGRSDRGVNRTLTVNAVAVNGAPTEIEAVGFVTFSAKTTVYLNAWQNSGSTLTVDAGIYYYKLGI